MKTNTFHAKKVLALLFAALLPLVASAEKVEIDGIWYNLISKGKVAEVTYKGDSYDSYDDEYSGSITIPATVTYDGVAYSVTSIGDYAFYDCSSLTAITLPEGVTSIGGSAFEGCSSLTAITIPEGVTSIGKSAFYNCSSLTAITIPEGVTSIGDYAFQGCSSLTAITIPEGVTSIGWYTFSDCRSLTAITIPESVTSIWNYAFRDCTSLTAITLPEGVTSIERYAFSNCTSLTAITIPESVTSIGGSAFDGCSSLTAVHISSIEAWCKISFNRTYYDNYSNPLYYAHNLYLNGELVTELVIPEGVTSIGDEAFRGCSSLTAITIPEGVTSIGESAFRECSNLTAITIPEGVTSIGESAFRGCTSLTAINIPKGVTKIQDYTFSECTSLTNITLPEGVTSIGDWAFCDCTSLTAIVLPKSVKNIYRKAFAGCYELTDVYCYAEDVPKTEADAFDGSYPEYATLHVPASAINDYKATAPWSSFGKIIAVGASITEITLSESSATLTEGEDLTLTMTTNPENADRNLISWSSSNPSVATVDNTGKVTAIAPGTATITATANDGSGVSAQCEVTVTPACYVITFLIDGEQVLVQTLTHGSAITLPDVPTKEGYTFSGWGEVPETMPARDTTFNATFIINKYLVTYKIGDEVIAADSLEFKSAIVAPEAPEKEGYTFNGWGEVADSVPAHDLTYEGSYSINSYTLTYVVDGEAALTLPIVYGATIPSLKVPAKEGYKFSGWSEAPAVMPAKDVTIEGTFTQLPSIYLTINQADNGCVKQHLVVGTVCAYTIEAAEGWKIHTVTFNGEDVTSQLTEEGTFTTPELQDDATLNIAYEKIDDGIAGATASRIKVQGHQGVISITGTTEGEAIGLYTTSGTLVATATAEGESTHLTVSTGQVYIVKVADTVVKIGM